MKLKGITATVDSGTRLTLQRKMAFVGSVSTLISKSSVTECTLRLGLEHGVRIEPFSKLNRIRDAC
jgi:hypothetical protein